MLDDAFGRQEATPLAAVLQQDGTIHIYVDDEALWLSVALEDDDTLVVRGDESKRVMKVHGR